MLMSVKFRSIKFDPSESVRPATSLGIEANGYLAASLAVRGYIPATPIKIRGNRVVDGMIRLCVMTELNAMAIASGKPPLFDTIVVDSI